MVFHSEKRQLKACMRLFCFALESYEKDDIHYMFFPFLILVGVYVQPTQLDFLVIHLFSLVIIPKLANTRLLQRINSQAERYHSSDHQVFSNVASPISLKSNIVINICGETMSKDHFYVSVEIPNWYKILLVHLWYVFSHTFFSLQNT